MLHDRIAFAILLILFSIHGFPISGTQVAPGTQAQAKRPGEPAATWGGVTMQQEASMVYLNENLPFPRFFTPSDLRSLLGEEHCPSGELIVLERAGNAVTVIMSEENPPCVSELRKAILKGKKVSVKVSEERELRQLFTQICRFFGFTRQQ